MPHRFRPLVAAALALGAATVLPATADAQLRSGFRSTLAPRGDDNLQPFVDFGFSINIRGGDYTSAAGCMNGYIGISPLVLDPTACGFTFTSLTALTDANGGTVVAVLPRDLNSGPAASGQFGWGAGTVEGAQAFGFTWDGVFSFGTTTPNFFQAIFINRGGGDFDLEYNYGALAAGTIPFAGVGDDGGFSGTRYEATITATPNSRITQCWRSGTVGNCGATSVVPEPSTVAMVAAGFLALGGTVVRRRRAA